MPDDGKTEATALSSSDSQGWREIAEKASKKGSPHALKLVQQLCDKIDERNGIGKKAPQP